MVSERHNGGGGYRTLVRDLEIRTLHQAVQLTQSGFKKGANEGKEVQESHRLRRII